MEKYSKVFLKNIHLSIFPISAQIRALNYGTSKYISEKSPKIHGAPSQLHEPIYAKT
jgi:hypothetical protein